MKKWGVIIGCALVVFLIVQVVPTLNHAEEHHGQLSKEIKGSTADLSYDLAFNQRMDTADLIKVHAGIESVKPFFTESRTGELTSFPCANCHKGSLDNMAQFDDPKHKKSHWNMKIDHADKMECTTCHSSENTNHLELIGGEKVSFDRSFEVCAQCHSSQFKDWQGGAHGKQLNGWAPPRVAKTCVSCHNPHKPAFPKKFPARYNTHQLDNAN